LDSRLKKVTLFSILKFNNSLIKFKFWKGWIGDSSKLWISEATQIRSKSQWK
jgi:hypothetical protein